MVASETVSLLCSNTPYVTLIVIPKNHCQMTASKNTDLIKSLLLQTLCGSSDGKMFKLLKLEPSSWFLTQFWKNAALQKRPYPPATLDCPISQT